MEKSPPRYLCQAQPLAGSSLEAAQHQAVRQLFSPQQALVNNVPLSTPTPNKFLPKLTISFLGLKENKHQDRSGTQLRKATSDFTLGEVEGHSSDEVSVTPSHRSNVASSPVVPRESTY